VPFTGLGCAPAQLAGNFTRSPPTNRADTSRTIRSLQFNRVDAPAFWNFFGRIWKFLDRLRSAFVVGEREMRRGFSKEDIPMRNRRGFLTGAGLLAITLAAFGGAPPVQAQATCSTCKTTSLLLPLAGAIFFPPNPCVPAGENVALAGDVHVVTKVGPNFVTDVHLNMAGVLATGQTSGGLYIGTGSQKFVGVQYPPSPVFPPVPVLPATFTLETTNGCASLPFFVTFTAAFSSDGTLLPESTVSLGGGT
jgi:hypothetical protein